MFNDIEVTPDEVIRYIAELFIRNMKALDTIQTLKAQLNYIQEQNTQIEALKQERDNLVSRLNAIEAENIHLKGRLKELEQENLQLRARTGELENLVKELQAKLKELENANSISDDKVKKRSKK